MSKPSTIGLVSGGVILLLGSLAWTAWAWHQQSSVPTEVEHAQISSSSSANSRQNDPITAAVAMSAGHLDDAQTVLNSAVKGDEPLPPSDTPWPELYDALSERAARGDARAASRLYQDLERCRRYGFALDSAKFYLASASSVDTLSESDLKVNLKGAARLESTLADGKTMCRDTSPEELSEIRYSVLRQAAMAGDESAAACFVRGPFDSSKPAPSRERSGEYASYADQLMLQGVARGDWRMVSLLAKYYDRTSRPFAPLWETEMFPDEPRKAYMYTAVQMMGAHAAGDDAAMERLRGAMTEIARRIQWTGDEQQSTLQQATDIYRNYFSASPYQRSSDMEWCSP